MVVCIFGKESCLLYEGLERISDFITSFMKKWNCQIIGHFRACSFLLLEFMHVILRWRYILGNCVHVSMKTNCPIKMESSHNCHVLCEWIWSSMDCDLIVFGSHKFLYLVKIKQCCRISSQNRCNITLIIIFILLTYVP